MSSAWKITTQKLESYLSMITTWITACHLFLQMMLWNKCCHLYKRSQRRKWSLIFQRSQCRNLSLIFQRSQLEIWLIIFSYRWCCEIDVVICIKDPNEENGIASFKDQNLKYGLSSLLQMSLGNKQCHLHIRSQCRKGRVDKPFNFHQ